VPVALNTANLLDVYVRASDKSYWHRSQVASLPTGDTFVDWNDWESLGGLFSSGPSLVINTDGYAVSFGRGADKAVWYKTQLGNAQWTKWTSLRGISSSGPSVRIRTDGLIDVYARGVDKQIWSKGQLLTGNSTEFGTWRAVSHSGFSEPFAC
jgi:hypothetical protein